MNNFMQRILRLVILLFSLLTLTSVSAQSTVTIGILAFRPASDVQQRWQPLVDHLNRSIPEHKFTMRAYAYRDLETAIARRSIDFVFTNPGHYMLMTYRNGLSSPLATLVPLIKGRTLPKFGGVIFTLADRGDITELIDLRGKSIASVTQGSLGGYQAEALELKIAGISIPKDASLVQTGMPHDLVVHAVLKQEADVGFVRTGILEDMAAEGKLDLARLRIIAPRNEPEFPLLLSTRLYPEWPFAAMPGIDQNLAREVTATLLSLPHEGELARQLGIYGFTIPIDYDAVHKMLEALRLPPFEKVPEFTLADIWSRYRIAFLAGISVVLVIVMLTMWLVIMARRLSEGRLQVQTAANKWLRLITALGEGVYGVDANGNCTFANPAAQTMLGFHEQELLGQDQHSMFHDHREDGSHYPSEECPISLTLRDGLERTSEDWFWRKDGSGFPVVMTCAPLGKAGNREGVVVVFRDISEQRELHRKLQVEATTDPLTGIANRRLFMQQMATELARFKRFGEMASVIMIDIDHFKLVNDNHGHATGDLVLKHLTELAKESLRTADSIGRLGGEEFGIMLTVTDAMEASSFAERLRQKIGDTPAKAQGEEISITISCGVTVFDYADETPDEVLERADEALYLAKNGGRDRVMVKLPEFMSMQPGRSEPSLVKLQWKARHACGEKTIDGEHQELFRLANNLLDLATMPDLTSEELIAEFDRLLQHVGEHFKHEEQILREYGYGQLEEHMQRHRELVDRAIEVRQEVSKELFAVEDLVNFLVFEVVVTHMLKEDRKFYALFSDPYRPKQQELL
jgi:diguanylate cyclase (GGDEF)-like protein/hemerythrin-like metal-binding protein/PAS domain S-box-containing protein